jgi:hypothetical protein
MASVDEEAHFRHVKVIRCNINPELVEKCRNVENEPISGKKLRLCAPRPIFQTSHLFFENEDSMLEVYFIINLDL